MTLSFGLLACNEEIPRHQKVTDEIVDTQVEPSASTPERQPQFGLDHMQIQELIESGSAVDWMVALQKLESRLFGPGTEDKSQYGSRPYSGYLALYRDLFVKFKSSEENEFKNRFAQSLQNFYERFIDPCIDDSVAVCSYIRETLPRTTSLVSVILHFIENEEDSNKKLKLVGVAYEVGNRRQKNQLAQFYIEAFFTMVDHGEEIPERSRHAHNVIAAFQLMDWQNPTVFQYRYFVRIAPWERAQTDSSLVDRELKNFLTPYISIFANENPQIKESFDLYAKQYWQKLIDGKRDLSNYPAYKDIQIREMFDLTPWEYHVLFSVYFKEMSITQANSLIRSFPNKKESLVRLIGASQLLIRWDLAIMATETNQKIADYYNSQETKSAQHVRASRDFANTLRPDWVEFHTGRVEALQNLLEAQSTSLDSEQINEIAKFFNSIDRTVMKTVIYPNMMAFMYEMVRSEWKDTLFGIFDINADLIVELFFAGAYRGLWFDFLKSEDGIGAGQLKNKVSLFRHEIVDSFYYFFSGNVYKAYGFNPDDFVLVLFKDLVIERELLITSVQEMQRDLYMSPDTQPRRWAQWCEGIKNNRKEPELIRYFDLDKFLLGHTKDFVVSTDRYFTHSFYSDEFRSTEFDSIMIEPIDFTHTTALTVTARIRQEMLPILGYFGQVMGAYSKLQKENPEFSRVDLSRTSDYIAKLDSRIRSYLGQQAYFGKIFDDCLYVSVAESRRRAKQVVMSEKMYFTDMVYPLLKAVAESKISVEEANDILFQVNGQSLHYDSRVIRSESGEQVYYKHTKQSYINRVRRYLTTGLQYIQPEIATLEIPAIVGPSLTIQVPPNALSSPDFPYRDVPDSVVFYRPNLTAEEMALEAISQSSDQFSFSPVREVYSHWDESEVIEYFSNQENHESYEKGRIDHLVQRYFFNGYKIANYEKPECRKINVTLADDCLIEETVKFEDMARAMRQSFDMITIDDDKKEYLEAIKETDFLHKQHLGIQLLFDSGLGREQSKIYSVFRERDKAIPFSQLKGFMDLPLEMISSPYLARNFINDYYVSLHMQAAGQNGLRPTVSTSFDRDGDFWKNYFFRAKEFFEARTRRGLFLFKFDEEILQKQFVQAKADLQLQLQGARELYEKADALFAEQYPSEGSVSLQISLEQDPYELRALSRSVYQYQNEMKQFETNTEGFYEKDQPAWTPYLLNH